MVDAELDELIGGLAAVSVDGPKGVGKTQFPAHRQRRAHRCCHPLRGRPHRDAPDATDGTRRARPRRSDRQPERVASRAHRRAGVPELGHVVRRPATLRAWLRSYAAATASTASYESILDAATSGDTDKPAKATTIAYRDVLTQLWLLEPLPGWLPGHSLLGRPGLSPKHHLADPALAARLLGADAAFLLAGREPATRIPGNGLLLGALFECAATSNR